jgi:hypothetical protein
MVLVTRIAENHLGQWAYAAAQIRSDCTGHL